MKKEQEKLIQSAIKANYRDKYIEMLSDETLSIQTLKFYIWFIKNISGWRYILRYISFNKKLHCW